MEKTKNTKKKTQWVPIILVWNSLIKWEHTAEPGFIGVQPGSGVITWPPVSVCQNVSAMEHFSFPIFL